jgi:ParB family chromosome partitioning protein
LDVLGSLRWGTVVTSDGQQIGANSSEDEDDEALKPLPERLVMELTAHRTLALREYGRFR